LARASISGHLSSLLTRPLPLLLRRRHDALLRREAAHPLADKQSAKTIALEFEVGEADVLALAKPKAVHVSQPSGFTIFGKGKNDRGESPRVNVT